MNAPDDLQATRVRLASVLGALRGIASIPSLTGPDGRPQSIAVRIAQDALARYGGPDAMAEPMNAPARITVTVDRHGEPIVFGARDTPRARANGCSVVEYVRADQAAVERLTNAERALAAIAEFGDGMDRSPVAARMRERAREALAALRGHDA
jgi:hypothetical protein